MRNTRADVVAAALRVLDEQGLENCSMRRIAAQLGVQPSALYHHVPDKQTLLALMADEIAGEVGAAPFEGAGNGGSGGAVGSKGSAPAAGGAPAAGPVPAAGGATGSARATAEVAAGGAGGSENTGSAAEGSAPGGDPRSFCRELREAMLAVRDGADVVATASAFRLGASGIERRLAGLVGEDGARTLLLYTFGHAQSTQTHRQAAAFGALVDPEAADSTADLDASFDRGLDIILRGLAA